MLNMVLFIRTMSLMDLALEGNVLWNLNVT